MPRKYVPKTKKQARKYYRRRARYYSKRRTFRPQHIVRTGFPRTNMVRLRYVDGFSLDPSAGTLATHVFRANSIYDPNYTSLGHQPMNTDLWAQLYNHYTVVGAKITLHVHNAAGSGSDGLLAGVILTDDATYSVDPVTIMEQGLARYRLTNATLSSNKGNGLKVSKTFSAKRFFNVTNPMDNTNRIGAMFSANPVELSHFVCFVGAPPGSLVDYVSMRCTVVIDYICIFSEPKEQPQS